MFSLNILNSFFGFKEIKINTLKTTRLNKINKTLSFKKMMRHISVKKYAPEEQYLCRKDFQNK